jgi:DNA polymerase elongation subunit (family B)
LLKEDIPEDIFNDDERLLEWLKDNTIITPNKCMFVKKNIRAGLLPIILTELLMTRIMIKNSAKKVKCH